MAAHEVESTRVGWFGCRRRKITGGVGEWRDGLASGEASMAAQPATGGRSRRHDRRCFGRLEQEDQRLKKHYGCWMDIVRSHELESCILTRLTKPSVPVNLVNMHDSSSTDRTMSIQRP